MTDDIVTRLREWGGCGHDGSYDIEDGVPREMLRIAANEIEQLRAAGDALHAWITVNATSIQQERPSHDKVLSDWEEARRD